jgi:hypothetical protein
MQGKDANRRAERLKGGRKLKITTNEAIRGRKYLYHFLELSNFKFYDACYYLNDSFQTFVPFTETEVPGCQPTLTHQEVGETRVRNYTTFVDCNAEMYEVKEYTPPTAH